MKNRVWRWQNEPLPQCPTLFFNAGYFRLEAALKGRNNMPLMSLIENAKGPRKPTDWRHIPLHSPAPCD